MNEKFRKEQDPALESLEGKGWRERKGGESPEIGQIYRETIQPDSNVLVIGPSATVIHDPSLLLASHALGESETGKLFVADPISRSHAKSYEELEESIGGTVTGSGDVDSYFAELDQLRQKGIPLKEPTWLGVESAAQRISLPDGSVDVILDHNTSVFLGGLPELTQKREREETLRVIYKEYHRVLKQGGRLLLQTDKGKYGLDGRLSRKGLLTQILDDTGFSVKEVKVKDAFEIPVEKDIYQNWTPGSSEKIHGQDELKNELLYGRIIGRDGKYFLRFDEKIDHPSPDLFIAERLR